MSRDAINNLEQGRVIPSEAIIKLICREFGVDYDWLKYGEGEMFASEEAEVLSLLDDLLKGQHKKIQAAIKALARMDEDQLNGIEAYIDALIEEIKKEAGD